MTTLAEYEAMTTFDKLKLLHACHEVHATLDDLFNCDSCNILLQLN